MLRATPSEWSVDDTSISLEQYGNGIIAVKYPHAWETGGHKCVLKTHSGDDYFWRPEDYESKYDIIFFKTVDDALHALEVHKLA